MLKFILVSNFIFFCFSYTVPANTNMKKNRAFNKMEGQGSLSVKNLDFIRNSLGLYHLSKGDEELCWSGELRLIESAEFQSLVLGAKALVPHLGNEIQYHESQCTIKESSTFEAQAIFYKKNEKCGAMKTEYSFNVRMDKQKLLYKSTKTDLKANKILEEYECELIKVDSSAPREK